MGDTGIIITVVALFETMALGRWEVLIELACGTWIIASPVIFQFGGTLRTVHFVLGGAVILLALFELWQDRNRSISN